MTTLDQYKYIEGKKRKNENPSLVSVYVPYITYYYCTVTIYGTYRIKPIFYSLAATN